MCSIKNNKICNRLYYKFYIASWSSQNAFVDFCWIIASIKTMAATDEKVKFQHERCWIYLVILMSRMKVKQQTYFKLPFNHQCWETSLKVSVWILKHCFFHCWYCSQCNYYRQEKVLSLPRIINTFSITVLRTGQAARNVFIQNHTVNI